MFEAQENNNEIDSSNKNLLKNKKFIGFFIVDGFLLFALVLIFVGLFARSSDAALEASKLAEESHASSMEVIAQSRDESEQDNSVNEEDRQIIAEEPSKAKSETPKSDAIPSSGNISPKTIGNKPQSNLDVPPVVVQEEIDPNLALKEEIQNAYGITIKYGNAAEDYKPQNHTVTQLSDSATIRSCLNTLKSEMTKYPSGFFADFGGMKLTIYLVDSVANNAFSGYTDYEFSDNIKMTLVDSEYGLGMIFHHEMMHYIDRYITIKSYPSDHFLAYSILNPEDFSYGDAADTYYTYGNDNYSTAFFVSNYAQSNVREDRAELFKNMIGRSYAPIGMFDAGSPLLEKAKVISSQIYQYFPSVKKASSIYWDQFLK